MWLIVKVYVLLSRWLSVNSIVKYYMCTQTCKLYEQHYSYSYVARVCLYRSCIGTYECDLDYECTSSPGRSMHV